MLDGPKPGLIKLNGCFRIETADGKAVALRSSKGQALVALLATSRNGERSRSWLQAKLWSDRSPDQASGSLRQEVAQVRKILATAGIGLVSDRHRIALDLDSVAIQSDGPNEFLEGLDVRDSEFDLWLVTERMRRDTDNQHAPDGQRSRDPVGPVPEPPQDWTISITSPVGSTGIVRWFEGLVSDVVARMLREIFCATITLGPVAQTKCRLSVIEVQCFAPTPDSVELRMTLNHPTPQRQIWSGHHAFVLQGARITEQVEDLDLFDALINAFDDMLAPRQGGRPQDDPDQLCRLAVRNMFSMQKQKLVEADEMLKRAFDLNPRGIYLAWRAQIKTIQKVERHGDDPAALKEEGWQLGARALELEPNNSMVLSALSNTFGQLLSEHGKSRLLAERSVRLNPANPMAWWALSSSSVYTGQPAKAYDCAARGQRLSVMSPYRFWWYNQRFGASLVLGRIEEAMHFCEAAHLENPVFRPPLRYLIGMYAHQERFDEAVAVVDRLKRMEPEFEVGQLIGDGDYPASLLRRAPGLAIDKVGAML